MDACVAVFCASNSHVGLTTLAIRFLKTPNIHLIKFLKIMQLIFAHFLRTIFISDNFSSFQSFFLKYAFFLYFFIFELLLTMLMVKI